MNQELVLKELKAVISSIRELKENYILKDPLPEQICTSIASRLRFCIAALEEDTVRLEKL